LEELINCRVHDYYWDEDLSCAVTTLKILSELFYPALHPQVIEAAFGLNAGRFGFPMWFGRRSAAVYWKLWQPKRDSKRAADPALPRILQ